MTYVLSIRHIETGYIAEIYTRKQFPAAQRLLHEMVCNKLRDFGKLDTLGGHAAVEQCYNFTKSTVSKGFHISNTGYAARFEQIA